MSVRFLGPDTDAYVSSVQRHAAEFEERTGIELELEIVPSDLYFSNKIHHLLDGERAADVYMSGPVLVWEHQAAGFVRPLDEFLSRASDEYEPQDFCRPPVGRQPLERCLRRAARRGAAARDPGQLRVVQPGVPPVSPGGSRRRRAGLRGPSTSRRRARSSPVPAGASAASASAGPAPGTPCTPALRRSCGRTAAATSRTAVARSPRARPSAPRPTSWPRCTTPGRATGPSNGGTSWRSTSRAASTA